MAVSSPCDGMNENTPPPEAIGRYWRHGAGVVGYKMNCVPITPGIQFAFWFILDSLRVHIDFFLLTKMPKHRNCTDRHSGASFSPYRKPSVQASITTGAGNSEQLTALQQLASQLAAKKRIIIISGAGISTNAGSKSQKVHVTLCML